MKQTKDQVKFASNIQVLSQCRKEFKGGTWRQIWDNVGEQSHRQVWHQVRGQVRGQIHDKSN